jgi:p-cumate 2,3-dioxygenase beta subunit
MSIDAEILLRLRVENLLWQEADMIDQWRLDEWLTLYTDDAHYYVPPSDIDGDTADPDTSLFYIMDDRNRMQERVIRLKKVGAHSEWPRSKDITSDVFVGHYLHEIIERDGTLFIAKKTCVLDMEALRPHARISIIL